MSAKPLFKNREGRIFVLDARAEAIVELLCEQLGAVEQLSYGSFEVHFQGKRCASKITNSSAPRQVERPLTTE